MAAGALLSTGPLSIMTLIKFLLVGVALNCAVVFADTLNQSSAVLARGKNFEIHRPQLDEAWAIYAAKMSRGGQLPDEPRASVEAKLLNHIVETQILLQKATAEEKKQALDATEKLLVDSRKRFATEDDFTAWLKMMGMAPEVYRRRMIEQRTSELVIDREIGPKVSVSDEQLKKYYDDNAAAFDRPEQVRGRQIFFSIKDALGEQPLPDDKKKEKEILANKVKARLDKGEDFFTLYQEFSEEPWAKDQVPGDEMLYVKGQMPAEFDAAAFSLKTNEISGVVATKLGYHIIRVSAHQPAERLPLAEAAPRLKEFLVDEEIKKQMPAYLEKIRKEATVEILTGTTTAAAPVEN
jgi:peptidyl-prolyl cis-trans isomerase C